jgi:hypothetical protein
MNNEKWIKYKIPKKSDFTKSIINNKLKPTYFTLISPKHTDEKLKGTVIQKRTTVISHYYFVLDIL